MRLDFASPRWIASVAMTFLATFLWSSTSGADSWRLPKTERYCSDNGRYCLTVSPRQIESPLHYFSNEVEIVDPGTHQAARLYPELVPDAPTVEEAVPEAKGCTAILYRKKRLGFRKVIEFDLLNDVAPVSVLVDNDGEYIVTLDNWHLMGYGPTTVVIYRSDGSVVRYLGLDDFLLPEDIAALPRTVSSIRWREEAELLSEPRVLRLRLRSRSGQACVESPDVLISLEQGDPVEPLVALLPHEHTRVRAIPGTDSPVSQQVLDAHCQGVDVDELVPVDSKELLRRAVEVQSPEYPELARVARLSGVEQVSLVLNGSGDVECAFTVAPDRMGFGQVALQAVRNWRFPGTGRRQIGTIGFRFEAWTGCTDDPPTDEVIGRVE